MCFRNRFAGQKANFDDADEFLCVTRRDFPGCLRVEALQDTMQMAGRMFLDARAQALAPFLRAMRTVRATLKQRAPIQSRADGEYRQAFAFAQVFQNLQSQLAVAPRSCIVFWPKNIDQVMRNAAAFGQAGFSSTNVKAAIELRRIAGDNFP